MAGNKRLALIKRRWGFPYQGSLLSPAERKTGFSVPEDPLCNASKVPDQ